MSYNAIVVSPNLEIQQFFSTLLSRCGLTSICALTIREAEKALKAAVASVIICAENLPDGGIADVLHISRNCGAMTPVIVFSPFAGWDRYLEILRAGAFDYLLYPPANGEVQRVVLNALAHDFLERAKAAAGAAA